MAFTLRDVFRDTILGVYQTKPELEKAMRRLSYEDGAERYVVEEDKPKRKTTKKAETDGEEV